MIPHSYSRIVQISLIFFTILNLDSDISRHELIVLNSKVSGCVGFGSRFDSVD